jgi:hypothetical protein
LENAFIETDFTKKHCGRNMKNISPRSDEIELTLPQLKLLLAPEAS